MNVKALINALEEMHAQDIDASSYQLKYDHIRKKLMHPIDSCTRGESILYLPASWYRLTTIYFVEGT